MLGVIQTLILTLLKLWLLAFGLIIFIFGLFGRLIFLRLLAKPGNDEPEEARYGEVRKIVRPDGTVLHVELYGPETGTPIIFTHGLSNDSTYWYYAKKKLGDRFRLVIWDVIGTGKSTPAKDKNYSLDRMAQDLEAVLNLAEGKPAILVGHSLGGMITLSFCKLYPRHLNSLVRGLVLVNTTYTNPNKVASNPGLALFFQKVVMEPVSKINTILWPLAWLQAWLFYFNGLGILMARFSAFSGHETRGQLDYMARGFARTHPAVLGKQSLAINKYDAAQVLEKLNLPVLIVTSSIDRLCNPEASYFMHRKIKNSELLRLEPSGHETILEQNEPLMSRLAHFAGQPAEELKTAASSRS